MVHKRYRPPAGGGVVQILPIRNFSEPSEGSFRIAVRNEGRVVFLSTKPISDMDRAAVAAEVVAELVGGRVEPK